MRLDRMIRIHGAPVTFRIDHTTALEWNEFDVIPGLESTVISPDLEGLSAVVNGVAEFDV
jgi:hypothetical protein